MEQAYKELVSQHGGTWVHPVYSRYPRSGGSFKSFLKKNLKNLKTVGKKLAKNLQKESVGIALDAGKKILLENQSPTTAILGTLKQKKGDILKATTGAIADSFGKKGAGKGGAKRKTKGGCTKGGTKKKTGGTFKNKKLGTKSAPRTKKIYI